MNKRQLVAGVLGASLLATALPGLAFAQDEEMPHAAEGVEWTLESISDGEALADVPEGVETTLFLNGGELVGNAGCNSYFGSYEIDETNLSFPNPFGMTQSICEGPAQDVEDAYMPLLESSAGWEVEEGMLSLSDAEGTVTLVYGEPPVEITATDVDALAAELESLQAQIDEAAAAVTLLAEEAASVNVSKITKRISTNETDIAALQDKTQGLNVDNIKKRLSTAEKAITNLDNQMANVKKSLDSLDQVDKNQKKRIETLEKQTKDQEDRIAALEDQAP
jgi:heat shock protein HslJ